VNIQQYKAFLRAGLRVTFDWLENQTPEALAIMEKAGREIAAEDACAVARALSGPEGYASVFAEVDDGAMHTRVILEQAVEEVVEQDKAKGVQV